MRQYSSHWNSWDYLASAFMWKCSSTMSPMEEALVRVTPLGSGEVSRGPIKRPDPQTEAIVKQVVRELLQAMGFSCTVLAVDNPSIIELGPEDPPTVFIDIHGPHAGMLIGRRGEHLAQLQYLVNVLVNRRLSSWTRVIIDVEGYRSRREESLIALAYRVARQVARTKQPVTLEPMPANERRVIHVALRENPDVETRSSGEGINDESLSTRAAEIVKDASGRKGIPR